MAISDIKGTVSTTGIMNNRPVMPQGKVDPKLPTQEIPKQKTKNLVEKKTEQPVAKEASGSSLKEQFPKADVNHSSFSKSGLLINQILFISEKHVIIKLICAGDVLAAFEVVYIIPRVAYINQLRAIESSIGSILAL